MWLVHTRSSHLVLAHQIRAFGADRHGVLGAYRQGAPGADQQPGCGSRLRSLRTESGMATAEYTTGLLGALVIAGILYKLSAGDDSFIAGLIEDILEQIQSFVRGLLNSWERIG